MNASRRKFLGLSFLVRLSAIPVTNRDLPAGPRMMGVPVCECGQHMLSKGSEFGGPPLWAYCLNRNCRFFARMFRITGTPMELVRE